MADDEPICKKPFDWSIDDFEPKGDLLWKLIYKEALSKI